VGESAAIETAFLNQHDVEAIGVSIDRRRPHAARRALLADDEALHAELGQVRHQGRPEKNAGALLGDHHVIWLRLEFRPNGVISRIYRGPLALGRGDEKPGRLAARVSPVE
jgi:hypothetical protein